MKEKELKEYYEDPIHCRHCNKIIEGKLEQKKSDLARKIFCNKSCAAIFNLTGKVRNVTGNNQTGKHVSVSEFKVCPNCGNLKDSRAKVCTNCNELQNGISNKTLGYYINGHKYLTAKCQEIRRHARKTIEKSSKVRECEYCKNHEFNDILEVHHLRGILEFFKESLISEINHEDNLVWLCPNHHAMLEKNLIKL